MTKLFYQIKTDERIYFKHYATLEEAEQVAQGFANSRKFGNVSILQIKEEIEEVETVKAKSLYKIFGRAQ